MMNQLRSRIYLYTILSLILVIVVACGGNDEAPPEGNNPPTEEAELQVVVFETPAPTDTASPQQANETIATPLAAATAGSGLVGSTTDITQTAQTSAAVSGGTTNLDFSRPPDVNPLTGLKVDDPTLLKRRPLMVRVGNDISARPQVGLNQADIVYEEITEWWITRFTAIYLSQDLEMIAPIRSARLINLPLTAQYEGALASSGGSDGVRWELSQSSVVNLDEFFVPQPYFYRENEGWQTRLAFDSTVAREYLDSEDLDSGINLRGFIFDESPDLISFPETVVHDAEEVIIPYPQSTSRAKWVYDSASGKYLRFTTDDPMLDFNGDQIAAANVIIYFADHQDTDIVEDSNGATSIRINLNGRGAAWLLRDGKILKGNWETDGSETPNFIFDDGQPMPLKPGNSWVEVVPLSFEITIDGEAYDSLGAGTVATEGNGVGSEEAADEGPTPTLTPIGFRSRTPTPVATETSN
jgi:hypothetical protein